MLKIEMLNELWPQVTHDNIDTIFILTIAHCMDIIGMHIAKMLPI